MQQLADGSLLINTKQHLASSCTLPCCLRLIGYSVAIMTRLVLLVVPMLLFTHTCALVCDLYLNYREEGKPREIIKSRCGARNGYCIKVTYWDKDPKKKRGFSGGCDVGDCDSFGSDEFGWQSDGCRRDPDYGSEGEVCCCNDRDRCNAASQNNATAAFIAIITLLFSSAFV